MTTQTGAHETQASLVSLAPTQGQVRATVAVSVLMFVGVAIVAPYADLQLARIDAFIPTFEATIFVTDFITSVLLFSHFYLHQSRALLVLASGYLFASLIVIPHALSFPGAFSPSGLLGAGLQTTGWFYWFWHIGFATALLCYALMRDGKPPRLWKTIPASWAVPIVVVLVLVLVAALTLVATSGNDLMPRLFTDQTHIMPLNHRLGVFTLLICVGASVALWLRRHSVLDQWLVVVAAAAISEMVLTVSLITSRHSLGFYTGRFFSLATSTIVLIALLAETIRTQMHLAQVNAILRRERQNKLMNMEAMAASLSHELRQPLGALSTNVETALLVLEDTSPDFEELRAIARDISFDSHRSSQILDSFRDLFGTVLPHWRPLNLNEIVKGGLHSLRRTATASGVVLQVQLASDLPEIMGDSTQLVEVVTNLVQNAIEAVNLDKDRIVRIGTHRHESSSVILTVEDSGPGIPLDKLTAIFEAFVTTKPHGMGLGLALCRTIIERHGGQISARSAEGQKGAIFQVTLPVNQATSPDLH